jgi:hypothetical protein
MICSRVTGLVAARSGFPHQVTVQEAYLAGVALLSDRQPKRIRVESRADGFPAIWLHDDDASMARILVIIGPCDCASLLINSNTWSPTSRRNLGTRPLFEGNGDRAFGGTETISSPDTRLD